MDEKLVQATIAKHNIVGNIKTSWDAAVRDMFRPGRMYHYINQKIPVLKDEQMPRATMSVLEEHRSPAAFVGDYIAFSTDECAKFIAEAIIRYEEDGHRIYNNTIDWVSEIETILAHEYTHAISGHSEKMNQVLRKNSSEVEFRSALWATEIEANRGYYVDEDTMVYYAGMTDEIIAKDIPDIRKARSFWSIYQAIKNYILGKDNNNNNQGESSNEGQPNQANQNKSESGSSSSDNQQTGGGSQPKTTQKNAGQGSGNSGEKSGEQSKPNQGNGALASERQQKAYDMVKRHSKTMKEYQTEAPYGNPVEEGSVGKTTNHATGGKEPMVEASPQQVLRDYNEKCETKLIKRNLGKMKGVIKGQISKQKIATYSRPPKRTIEGDLMKKGKKKDTRFSPRILLALDCSGSMDGTSVTKIASTVDDIIKKVGRSTKGCYIVLHNGSLSEVKPLKDWEQLTSRYCASGGNDFVQVYLKAQELGCDVVLNVGDGGDSLMAYNSVELKKMEKNKKIVWYDCIVSELGRGFSVDVSEAILGDTMAGFNRQVLDLCNGFDGGYDNLIKQSRIQNEAKDLAKRYQNRVKQALNTKN